MKVDIVAPSAGEWHSQKGFSGICHAVKILNEVLLI
jgi:hypothetical protein